MTTRCETCDGRGKLYCGRSVTADEMKEKCFDIYTLATVERALPDCPACNGTGEVKQQLHPLEFLGRIADECVDDLLDMTDKEFRRESEELGLDVPEERIQKMRDGAKRLIEMSRMVAEHHQNDNKVETDDEEAT